MPAEVNPGRHSRPYGCAAEAGWLGQKRSECPGTVALDTGACAALLPQPPERPSGWPRESQMGAGAQNLGTSTHTLKLESRQIRKAWRPTKVAKDGKTERRGLW